MNAREYRRAQDAALTALLRRTKRLFTAYGVPVTPAQQDEMAALLLRSMRSARERVHDTAANYITSQLLLAPIPDLPDYPLQALSAALNEALTDFQVLGDPVTQGNRSDAIVVTQAGKRAQRAVSRHAQQPAREAVKTVADTTHGVGWARMLTGPTSCSFCAMLASRGPVYTTREAAAGRGGSFVDAFHDGCDCIAVLVVDPNGWEGRQAHERLEHLWVSVPNKNKRKAFRREWDAQVRSGGTGGYVADTMK